MTGVCDTAGGVENRCVGGRECDEGGVMLAVMAGLVDRDEEVREN